MLARSLTVAFCVVVVASACAESKPLAVTVEQLLATPERFEGKRIAVSGFFECAFEAGCELRRSRKREDRIHTILLDLTQQQHLALGKKTHVRGRLFVVGRFEYSRPHPDIVKGKSEDKASGLKREIVEVWHGFYFHSCQITAITQMKRI